MTDSDIWSDGQNTFRELNRQPYDDCVFSVGQVLDHPVDEYYLKWYRSDDDWGMLLLRNDEVAAINYLLASALWSDLVYQAEDTIPFPRKGAAIPHEA